jgi:uncharacterized membrane protein YkvA (DUF1232 family)
MVRGFWRKVRSAFRDAGYAVVEKALLLYFLLLDDGVPAPAKATIASALAYFVLPMDAVPDVLPGVGYGDDLAVLAAALTSVSMHLTPEVRRRAERVLRRLYG